MQHQSIQSLLLNHYCTSILNVSLINQVRVKSKRTEIATFVFWRSYVSRILKKPGADWLSAGYDTCEVFVCDRLMR